MYIGEFKKALFAKGTALGFADMEIYYAESKATSVNVQDKTIKNYVITEQGGVSLRGIYAGNMGYSSTEKLDDESINSLLQEAKANAEILEDTDKEALFAGAKTYAAVEPVSKAIKETQAEQLISAAFTLEDAALSADPAIKQVIQCKVSKVEGETVIANTKGLSCQESFAYISAGVYLMADSGAETTTGGEFDFTLRDFGEINLQSIAQKAATEAVSQLGAASIASGNYPIVLHYETATTLLGFLVATLSAETVQKGFSRFESRLGEQVAGSNIILVENPLMPGVLGTAAFDAEGYPTRKINLIDKGILKTFMHNQKTAKKAGTISTGNAVKNGYAAAVTVGPHNVYLEPGKNSLDEIISQMPEGILITELQGMHAGINTVSGDFSLAARGFLIEHGKVDRPINQITAAGNLYDLLGEVEEVASDLKCKGAVSSPSLKITALTISGE
ncbi:MAG: TldD/PmbA family protein [Pelosinus sp.]|nr:TldD/PmbA family protein [Pelosinus sp.]